MCSLSFVQPLLSWAADTQGGRKERAVVAGLLGVVLLLFELVLIARMVVDWVGVLSPEGGRSGLYQARRITHGIKTDLENRGVVHYRW
jgi:hypothetical protein